MKPYGKPIPFKANELIPFADFSIRPLAQESRELLIAGMGRQQSLQRFVIHFPDGRSTEREIVSGFPGGRPQSEFRFATDRRHFFGVTVSTDHLTVNPVTELHEAIAGSSQPVAIRLAEHGEWHRLGQNEEVALPGFSIRILEIRAQKKKRALSKEDITSWFEDTRKQAVAGIAQEHIEATLKSIDAMRARLEQDPNIETLHHTFALHLRDGETAQEICVSGDQPEAHRIDFGGRSYSFATRPDHEGRHNVNIEVLVQS